MKKKITVLTGVYNEEALVADVYRAIKDQMAKLKKYDYEHIFMDNCSTDRTLKILRNIAKKDKRVKVLAYSKNFGPEASGWTGLVHAKGNAVIPFEGNMKDPPELIPTLVKYWEEGYELVMAVRTETKDGYFLGNLRKLFYKLVNLISKDDLPQGFGSFSVIDHKIVDELRKIDDFNPYTRGLIANMGFRQIQVQYKRKARPKGKGKSKTNLSYLLDFAINAIISYSTLPIRLMTYTGLLLAIMSFFGAIIYLLLKLFYWKVTIPGITGVIFLVLFFSGIQLFFLGIIGEYVGAIHSQVRKKPFVIIKEKINF